MVEWYIDAYNGLSARLLNESKWDGIWASSFGISLSKGLPDSSILTMTDFLNTAREMKRVTQLPILADVDTGFGDIDQAKETVIQYEMAGINGICVEDKHFPKKNSFSSENQFLLPLDKMKEKIYQMCKVRRSKDFKILVRCEGFNVGFTLNNIIDRCIEYTKYPIDGLVIHSRKKSFHDEIEPFLNRFSELSDKPITLIPTSYYHDFPWTEPISWDIERIIFANIHIRLSYEALYEKSPPTPQQNEYIFHLLNGFPEMSYYVRQMNQETIPTVYMAMCGDIIHEGHLNIIREAKKYGRVVIGLLTDDAINTYKEHLPILKYPERYDMLSKIEGIYKIIPQYEATYINNLMIVRPQYVIHGDDWQRDNPNHQIMRSQVITWCKEFHANLIEIPYTNFISSTILKERLISGRKKFD